VDPAPADHFVVTTTFADPDIAGTPGTVTVAAYDPYGNLDASGPNQYLGTTDLASTDPRTANLPGTCTFTAADAGSHAFDDVILETAGTQTITATDSVKSSITGDAKVVVIPSAADHLVVRSGSGTSVVAGSAGTITVVAADHYGNTASIGPDQYLGTIKLSGTDGRMTGLPSSYTFTTADAGSHTFTGVALGTAGAQSIGATDAANGSVKGGASILVTPAGATKLVITTPPPSPIVAGQAFTVVVSAEDPFGNVDTSYDGDVTLTLPGQATATMVQAQNGVATFANLKLDASDQGSSIGVAGGGGVTGSTTGPVNVTGGNNGGGGGNNRNGSSGSNSPTPTIIGETAAILRKTNRKGKPVGKPVQVVFTLQYSTAMDPTTAGSMGNYVVEAASRKKGKKKAATLNPVPFTASYNAAKNSVTLTLSGKQTFAAGGEIKVIYAPPGGVSSAAGVALDPSDAEFTIAPKAKGVKPA
jgi:hypothetical protein